jgi:HK97 family phage major capsid protein
MARALNEVWITEEKDSATIRTIATTSLVEQVASPVPMKSNTKSISRVGDIDVSIVPKGSAYPEDGVEADEIVMVAKKFGTAVRIAEEDLDDQDSGRNILEENKVAWASAYAKKLDNSCFSTTGVIAGTTVPFTSVYKAIRTADEGQGYAADQNYRAVPRADFSFATISDAFAAYEDSEYGDPDQLVVLAASGIKGIVRTLTDVEGRLIFNPNPREDGGTDLLGAKTLFSKALRTSAVATKAPTGNPLIILANKQLLRLGRRGGPESRVIPAANSNTDEAQLIMRSRRAFQLGTPAGAFVLEITA